MGWTPEGLLQPNEQEKCLPKCRTCLDVCPFLDQAEDETTLAKACFGDVPGIQQTQETGYYLNAYVGHAGGGFRERAASGGMASWFLASLLEKGAVDRVICVRPNPDPERLFTYTVAVNTAEVRVGAKSAYYPVELSQAIHMILMEPKRYAVIGLPCALKGLRLAMLANEKLRNRIGVMAGLTCGQTKSRAFADFLIRSQAIDPGQVRSFSFREKDTSRPASNYFAKVTTSAKMARMPWTGLYGKTWLSGEFTPRPCRFCDDIFAEVADIAFMDAWLHDYVKDGYGTSIVLTRSEQARHWIEGGITRAEVSLQPMAIEKVIASQAGVVEQKRNILAYGLWIAGRSGVHLQKRVSPVRPSWFQRRVLVARENVRAVSHQAFRSSVPTSKDRISTYNLLMRNPHRRLNILYTLAHYQGKARTAVSRLLRTINFRAKR